MFKEHEAGVPEQDVLCRCRISKGKLYRWRAKYGGMKVAEAKRLKELESASARLKHLLADEELDEAMG